MRLVWRFTIPFVLLKFWTQTRKPQDKVDSKVAYYINGSWYSNKSNTFSPLKRRVLVLFSLMRRSLKCLTNKVCMSFNSQIFNLFSQQDIVSNLNKYIFKSPSNVFYLDLMIITSVFLTWVKLYLHLLVQFFNRPI